MKQYSVCIDYLARHHSCARVKIAHEQRIRSIEDDQVVLVARAILVLLHELHAMLH
tara:strand:- start:938 stop:1105 length:168 start_codon:yes stop_codon:yes gene_type:complete